MVCMLVHVEEAVHQAVQEHRCCDTQAMRCVQCMLWGACCGVHAVECMLCSVPCSLGACLVSPLTVEWMLYVLLARAVQSGSVDSSSVIYIKPGTNILVTA